MSFARRSSSTPFPLPPHFLFLFSLFSAILFNPILCWWNFGNKAATVPKPAAIGGKEGIEGTELRMPAVDTPRDDMYMCSAFPLDTELEHYIVGFKPLADTHQIHHIIIYGCEEPGSAEAEEAWDCGEMGSSVSHRPVCASQPDIIYAWAHNAPELMLPKGVAFRVGGASRARSLVLQVHYMHKAEGDESGIRILHTDQPQSRIAATLLLATDGRMGPKKTEQLEVACVVDEPVQLHPFAFRVHTHRHGTNVGGWLVKEGSDGKDQWTLLGQRNPQDPQMFQSVANKSVVISQGDVLAARCTIENGEKRELKVGPTGEDEMCNFYLMYWTDGDQMLEQNACFSPGPPLYHWTNSAGLNQIPSKK